MPECKEIETDLIKNLNFCMSNFGDTVSNISVADYKKIFIDIGKIDRTTLLKMSKVTLKDNYPLPFNYNFLFSFGIKFSEEEELYLDAVFIDNTNPQMQKVYALVGNNSHTVVAFNKTKNGITFAPDTCNKITKTVAGIIEMHIASWIKLLSVSKLVKHPNRENSYRFK